MSVEFPAISVIVPARDAGPMLSECLDSIMSQSFTDWELIIADDGSSDGTLETAGRYAGSDPRIKVISTGGKGVSSARNAALDTARGRYIAFVDSDDLVHEDYLRELLLRAKADGADITQCSFCFIGQDGSRTSDPYPFDGVLKDRRAITDAYFSGPVGNIRVSVWGKLFRRDAFSGIRFDPQLRVSEDAYYVYMCIRRAETVSCFSDSLYLYRQHGGSTMSAGLGEICRDYFKVFEKQAADFRDDPSVSRKIARRETETALWLMRKFAKEGPDDLLCGLRRSALRRYGSVLFSPAPFRLKLKLTGLALMPHVYLALLRRRTVPENA